MKKEAFYSNIEIGTIDLTRLKKNLHGEFTHDVLQMAEESEAIGRLLAPQLQAFRAAVEDETRADFVSTDAPLSDELNALLDSRDKVETGFKSGCRAMMEMDDEAVRQAGTTLFELTHRHNLHTDMNADAQTDAIRDFVADVRANHMALVELCGLTPLFEKLAAVNERVCDIKLEQRREEAEIVYGRFAAARKATDEAYKELIFGVKAYGFVEGTAQFSSFISDLNSLIIYYRRVHLKEKIEFPDTEPGDGDENTVPGDSDGDNTGGDNNTPGGSGGGTDLVPDDENGGSTGGSTGGGSTGGDSTGGGSTGGSTGGGSGTPNHPTSPDDNMDL